MGEVTHQLIATLKRMLLGCIAGNPAQRRMTLGLSLIHIQMCIRDSVQVDGLQLELGICQPPGVGGVRLDDQQVAVVGIREVELQQRLAGQELLGHCEPGSAIRLWLRVAVVLVRHHRLSDSDRPAAVPDDVADKLGIVVIGDPDLAILVRLLRCV